MKFLNMIQFGFEKKLPCFTPTDFLPASIQKQHLN